MASNELIAELQRLQLMINAVRKALPEEDTEATLLLYGITERLMMLSEVAEASALADEEVLEANARPIADLTHPD